MIRFCSTVYNHHSIYFDTLVIVVDGCRNRHYCDSSLLPSFVIGKRPVCVIRSTWCRLYITSQQKFPQANVYTSMRINHRSAINRTTDVKNVACMTNSLECFSHWWWWRWWTPGVLNRNINMFARCTHYFLPFPTGKTIWQLVLEQFDDLLVKILLLAAIISFVSICWLLFPLTLTLTGSNVWVVQPARQLNDGPERRIRFPDEL